MKCNRLVGTTIFASSKTKSRFYLVIYKNTCTFAAVLVFVRFYIRSDARMVIVKVHNTIGISSDAHSFFFFYYRKKQWKIWNISPKCLEHSEILTIFATSKGSLWLSGQNPARGKPLSTLPNFSMPKVLFDYPGRIPRGQDLIDTTQKRWTFYAHLLFFVIIRCLKNKTEIFLAVWLFICTFAAD